MDAYRNISGADGLNPERTENLVHSLRENDGDEVFCFDLGGFQRGRDFQGAFRKFGVCLLAVSAVCITRYECGRRWRFKSFCKNGRMDAFKIVCEHKFLTCCSEIFWIFF